MSAEIGLEFFYVLLAEAMDMLFSHHENSHNKVLVVDDEPTSLMIMAESLSDLGEIVCCDNGAQAIEKAAFFQPDVILLDIEMPGMNGFEVCQKSTKLSIAIKNS